LALIFGFMAARLGLPALVGYLIAGVVIDDLLAVRKVALPGATVGMLVATSVGAGLATLWGWTTGAAIVFGLSLSVASTVVLLKALESRGPIDTANGRIAIGWLVVEDVVMVMVLVLLPAVSPALGGALCTGRSAAPPRPS